MDNTASQSHSDAIHSDNFFKKENFIYMDKFDFVHVKTPKGTRMLSLFNAIRFIEKGIEEEFGDPHYINCKQS